MENNSLTTGNIIKLQNLEIGYRSSGGREAAVFCPLSVEINHSEMVGLIGRNGIGKSTLLRTIAGILKPLKGNVLIRDQKISQFSGNELARLVSYVSTEHIGNMHIKVHELIALGRFPYTGWFGRLDYVSRQKISDAAEQTNVTHLMQKPAHELSDGEQQRVMIARALAQDTPIIILDEPTAFLDLPARYVILKILNELTQRNHKTILFSTHDLSVAMEVADKLWLMAEGEIFQGAPEDLLISKVFRKLFINSPAEFDIRSSSFRFKKELRNEISIHGDEKYRLLTKRAMERIGLKTSLKDVEDIEIIICETGDTPTWILKQKELKHSFDSIYALTSFLKNSDQNMQSKNSLPTIP
jgi:iron complex transport system ATP-binding protein